MQRVAAIQMCSTHLVKDNLAIAKTLITQASQNDAQLIVLPEMFAIMQNSEEELKTKEKFGQGLIQDFLSAQAQTNNTWILGGTIPIACEHSNKIKAASILYDSNGKVAARYDKIHLFDVELSENEKYKESDTITPGNELVVIDTPVGKLGLGVCYDIRFPEMFRYLFNQGAEIIALPAAFTVKTGTAHWELLTRSRAVENFSYLIGANQGGTHSGDRKTYGHSLIVNPWGEIIAKKEDLNPGIIYADIDLNLLHEIRKSIPVAKHQRIFFDVDKLKKK